MQADDEAWSDIVDVARGQTVYFYAWGGDQKVNAYLVMRRLPVLLVTHDRDDAEAAGGGIVQFVQ